MDNNKLKEIDLENTIETWLIDGGKGGDYLKGDPDQFNRHTGLDEKTMLTFIKSTQEKSWARFEKAYPIDPEQFFISNLCKEIKNRGLLSVLRNGYKDRGIPFKICYFKPENDINKESVELYDKNILHCTRQLHYSLSSENSIDIVLFLNGIPLVSMELKNQFTGQDVSNAITQYKFDRATKDIIFEFKNRVLVHFAVDLYNVYMTTRLQGSKTYFLPFNKGSHGAGNVGGKGNPANPDGFVTSYLWEYILCKDKLMEILQKYLHLEVEKDRKSNRVIKETMIFPRYHQLDVVTKLVSNAKDNGSGTNYLIQHSAGSGKSNSIAWLSHQLSGLHNNDNEKVFNSVIVLTDRKVLDSQLQDTIYQFDHKAGVVVPVKNGSKELLESINNNTPIIISTLQKFPIIYKDISAIDKKFAIIIDEAHSSQTGKSATTVISGLSDLEDTLKEYAEIEGVEELSKEDEEDLLVKTLASQGHHQNLSFFAFTATPKPKTLNRFGVRLNDGTHKPFHVYSMRQAIEEGFILDVLQNYTTYKAYYNIVKKIKDDPELEKSKGKKAILRFQTLHPHNIAQKTAIMIEHFNEVTKNKIGGQGKAMVVTPSRLHAVKYLFAFRDYIKQNGYNDIEVLVAFSGDLNNEGKNWTEEKINKTNDGKTIKENQLKEYFHSEDFNILIVAEKYQTGFDEPLLHTMYVDKKLTDVKAVQTLSRLNRIAKGKTDTFVLDFVNEIDDIQKSFQQFYQATILTKEMNPNDLYSLKSALDDSQIYQHYEVENFGKMFYSNKKSGDELGKLSGILKPAIDRFDSKTEEEQEAFRITLNNFIKMYAFIIQIIRLFDKELEMFYVYSKFLIKCLKRPKGEGVNLKDKVLLEYYKLEKTYSGAIALKKDDGLVESPTSGTGSSVVKEKNSLSALIEEFNQRFGTDFTDMDKVLSQVKRDLYKDEMLVKAGQDKDKTLFNSLYEKTFNNAMTDRYERNDQFFQDLFSDEEKMDFMKKMLLRVFYDEVSVKL